jgi:hypothetical protein
MKFLRNLFGLDIDPYPNVPKNKVNDLFIKKVGPTNSGHNGIFFHFPKFPSTNNSLMEVCNEFDKTLIVQPNSINECRGFSSTLYGNIDISISIILNNREPRLIVINHSKNMKPKAGDSLSFLFENGEIIKFTFIRDSLKFDNDGGIRLSNEIILTDEELLAFANHQIKKWNMDIEKINLSMLEEVKTRDADLVRINAKMIQIYLEEM